MGTYVTLVIAVGIIIFTAMTIESQSMTCKASFLSDSRYCDSVPNLVHASSDPAAASSSANFASVIQACKNIAESTAKIHQFYPITGMDWHGGSTEDEVQIDDSKEVDYIQRRANVPLAQIEFLGGAKFRHMQKIKDQVTLDGEKYEVYFPVKSGEFQGLENLYLSKTRCDDPDDDSHCKEQHQIYFVDYELVFLRHLDASGNPIVIPGTNTPGNEYNVADIYQSVKSISDPKVGALPDEAFDCTKIGQDLTASASATPVIPQLQAVIPEQQDSQDNSQVQLQWFAFGTAADEPPVPQPVPALGFQIACKPAVYLYPPHPEMVNVKVTPNGFLTYTDPQYNPVTGWNVMAYPSGALTTTYNLLTTNYDYLYYESKIRDEAIEKPTKGWVIKSDQLTVGSEQSNTSWFNPLQDKFNQILPELGLNHQQTQDFINYWKKALPYSPYYFVGVINQDNVNSFEKLDITPKPDSINRVRLYFERLDHPKTIEAPILSTTYNLQPTNFNVVEWGGMVKNDPNHPFTCSQ